MTMKPTPIQSIGQQADVEAKAATPRVVYPSNGGLNNPKFKYRRGSDIANTRYGAVAGVQTKTKVVALVDRVAVVRNFGGTKP